MSGPPPSSRPSGDGPEAVTVYGREHTGSSAPRFTPVGHLTVSPVRTDVIRMLVSNGHGS